MPSGESVMPPSEPFKLEIACRLDSAGAFASSLQIPNANRITHGDESIVGQEADEVDAHRRHHGPLYARELLHFASAHHVPNSD